MYFLNNKKLKTDLKNNRVSQRDYFIYFILSGIPIFQTLVLDFRFSDEYKNINGYISAGIGIISLLILIHLYRINNKIDKKHFFERFFSINFVIRVKLFIFLWIPFLIINLTLKKRLNWDKEKYLMVTNLLSFLNITIYYFWIVKDFKHLKFLILKKNSTQSIDIKI